MTIPAGFRVECLTTVYFPFISTITMRMLIAIWQSYQEQGCSPTITGAGEESYREGGVHRRGKAIDVRIWDLPDPRLAAQRISAILSTVGGGYVIRYGDPQHLDHIHVGLGTDANDISLKGGKNDEH